MKGMGTVKKVSAWLLAAALLFCPLMRIQLYAAGGVDTTKECSIQFGIEEMDNSEYAELNKLEIPVALYKVADMKASGSYTPKAGFEGLQLSEVSSATTAEEWKELAGQAVKMAGEANVKPQDTIVLHSGADSLDTLSGLSVGMYLVAAETVRSAWYEYSFTPYLVSLPNNYYYGTQDDSWVYDVETQLKPDPAPRYGDLEIIKTLSSYNQTFGPAFFVFSVEAERNGKNVYSDVVSINFTEPGIKKTLVKQIPAGSLVTVTEIYSGASYKAVTGTKKQVHIIAAGDDGNPVSVSFENEYNHQPNGGSGIVNHFNYKDGTWGVEQKPDNTGGQ